MQALDTQQTLNIIFSPVSVPTPPSLFHSLQLGDETMSVLEIWGAEYQENDCLLIKPESRELLQSVCDRERSLMQVIGTIDGSGRITLVDKQAPAGTSPAVDLDLEKVRENAARV